MKYAIIRETLLGAFLAATKVLVGCISIYTAEIFQTTAASPVVIAVNPNSGAAGTSIAITGSSFSPVPANNTVYFGAVRAAVTAAAASSLTTTAPIGATYAPVTVTVNGLTAYAPAPFLTTFSGAGNIGTSSLTGRVDLAAGDHPLHVAIGDIDGDGKPDLVFANYLGGSVSVYRNVSTSGSLSAGSFGARLDLAVGLNPLGLALDDLDGDGRLDIVAVNSGNNSMTVLKNLSIAGSITAGSFAPRVDLMTASTPASVVIRDLDGDGKPDLVVANSGAAYISVYRNIGTSGSITTNSFAARVDFMTGSAARRVAVGDLDGDGKPDIAVANNGANTVSILRNTSTSGVIAADSFAAKVDFPTPTGPGAVAIGDLDGDGKSDLAGVSYLGNALWLYRNTSTVGTFNASSFGARVDFATGGRGHTVAIGDLDGDGKPDLAVVTELPSHLSLFKNLSSPGDLTSTSLGTRVDFGSGWNPEGVALGDLDGDGKPDIAFANQYDDTISVYRNIVPLMTPPPSMVMYDLSADYSLSSNPNGVWSYGAKPTLNGPFSIFAVKGTVSSDNGVPLDYWQLIPQAEPTIHRNGTTNTAISFGGRIVVPPGGVTLWSGTDGYSNEFGVVRFTVPTGGSGTYRVETAVRDYINDWPQGDTDFHVLKNATELFGQQLPANGSTSYSNIVVLSAGDRVEFLVGRGADHSGEYSALFITAKVSLVSSNLPPPACVPAPSGLVSWWPGEGNANDVADANDGTLQGGLGFGTGKVGQAFNFDGMNDFVSVPASANLDVGAGNGFTFECWISPATLNAAPLAEWRRELTPQAGVHFWGSVSGGGELFANVVDTNGNSHVFTSPAGVLTVNSLQHVALTYDRTTGLAKMYRNGMVVAQQNLGTFRPDTTRALRLGARPESGSTFYKGLMDEASLYNRVLGDGEIAAIYNADAAGKCPTTAPPACVPPVSGLVSWWPAQGNANDAADANNGTLQGGLGFGTGKVGQSFAFNNTTGHVRVAASANLNVGAGGGLTIEGWIKPSDLSKRNPIVEWNNGNFGAHFYILGPGELGLGAGNLQLNLVDTGGASHQVLAPGGTVTTNAFHHVAVTYDKASGLARIYRGGVIVAQQNLGGFTPQTSYALYLGRRPAGDGIFYYSGLMDEMSLYNRALSSNEIAGIFNAQAAGKCQETTPPPPVCVPPVSGLVSWWPAQGNANDVADANNGILQGGLGFGTGKVGQSFAFNNTTGHVRVAAGANLNVGVGSGLTLEAWIKPSDLSKRGPLVEWNNGAGTFGSHFYILGPGELGLGAGNLQLNLVDTGGGFHQLLAPGGTVTTNTFHHVAATYDRTTGLARIYRNGAIVAQQNLGSFTPQTSYDLYLGRRPSGDGIFNYSGLMDEMSLYNRALASNEIAAIYNADAAGKCRQPSPPGPTEVRVVDVSAASGGTVDVPIQLAAQGTENALGFSLNFDPSLLEFSNVALASDAPDDATLIANADQVNSGRLGVAVALPSGATFLARTQQVVTVRFNVAPVLPGVTIPVTFGNQPTVRQVSDQLAQPLPAMFVDGIVTVSEVGFEADTAPRPSGNGQVTIIDWVQVGRFVAHLDTLGAGEFQRADCAPRNPRGNGRLSITDWVQAGRYAAGLDPLTAAGGPSSPAGPALHRGLPQPWPRLAARWRCQEPMSRLVVH